MANPKSTLERLIDEHGGKLIRHRKHQVFRFPDGRTFIVSSTPECPRSYDNATAFLKTMLGVHPPDRGTPGERRDKRIKRKPEGSLLPDTFHAIAPNVWQEILAAVKPELPPRPLAKQRAMSASKIFKQPVSESELIPAKRNLTPKIIKHPVHRGPRPISTMPPVAIEKLVKKFGVKC